MIDRDNLATLAAYLEQLPAKYRRFDMAQFAVTPRAGRYVPPAKSPHCGTVACAAGHGPKAGIPALKGESWTEYSNRVFVDQDADWAAWDWCFGASWARYDNTPEGAAKRIRYLLAHGVPGKFRRGDFESRQQFVELYQ